MDRDKNGFTLEERISLQYCSCCPHRYHKPGHLLWQCGLEDGDNCPAADKIATYRKSWLEEE